MSCIFAIHVSFVLKNTHGIINCLLPPPSVYLLSVLVQL